LRRAQAEALASAGDVPERRIVRADLRERIAGPNRRSWVLVAHAPLELGVVQAREQIGRVRTLHQGLHVRDEGDVIRRDEYQFGPSPQTASS
jgi:hypothetical protein